jgi:hypothetical protein
MAELLLSVDVNAVLGALLWAILLWKAPRGEIPLSGPDEAMQAFQAVFPDAAGAAYISNDNRSALIALQPDDRIGFIQRRGRRWNARKLGRSDILSVRLDSNDAINITFSDFGWPRACIIFADAGTRTIWLDRLNSLTSADAPSTHSTVRNA